MINTLAHLLCIMLAQASGWRRWWLPANHAEHGNNVDLLFTAIFIITSAVGIIVLFLLLKYCIQYRHRADRRAHFTHGNKKLELIWTIVPTFLLLGLALWTKGTWDNFRYGIEGKNDDAAEILVIAEQFKWNSVYPGPDGKLGQYLVFPKTTDARWPAPPPVDPDFFVRTGVPGPAFLPAQQAKTYINDFVGLNPMGKNFADPAGADDIWRVNDVFVPKGRMVAVKLTSKDVIHNFFLPEFRVKLDAVPGMRGELYFTSTTSSAEFEKPTLRNYPLGELSTAINTGDRPEYRIVIDPSEVDRYSKVEKIQKTRRVRDPKNPRRTIEVPDGEPEEIKQQLVKNDERIDASLIEQLRALGVAEVKAYRRKTWDLVCEELCGSGHTAMKGNLIVLEADEYARQFGAGPATATPAATMPSNTTAALSVQTVTPTR